ncbi:MAG: GH3 auxin-responsive promoter family protein [Anaerovoracaceae bacterium]
MPVDCGCYKDELEEMWGIRPMELFAGTEPTCIGTETWTREGMYFFPDACFYEFIPEDEMLRCSEDTGYQPRTCLMDEVVKGEKYEIVLSVLKGGAFMRYRVGDVYRCAGLENSKDGTRIPRFYYIDRVPDIIDIAGFTRITERSVRRREALGTCHRGLDCHQGIHRKQQACDEDVCRDETRMPDERCSEQDGNKRASDDILQIYGSGLRGSEEDPGVWILWM